jgi:cytochrome P450
MEAEIAVGSLLRRFPEMELATDRPDVRWRPSALLRGPAELPVRLRPVR